jgi:hypothetical protein
LHQQAEKKHLVKGWKVKTTIVGSTRKTTRSTLIAERFKTNSHNDAEINRFERLTSRGLTLSDGKGATRHFDRDPNCASPPEKRLAAETNARFSPSPSGSTTRTATEYRSTTGRAPYDDGAHDAVRRPSTPFR